MSDFFKLKERNTTVGREITAGVVTFMTMAYIIFVNPSILGDKAAMGPSYFNALVLATCLAAGITTLMMGLISNYPFALASGMGLNAVVAYTLIAGMKLPWQTAMAAIFLEGLIITILVLTKVREMVMDAIPLNLKRAIGVGIGLFIAFIGLKDAGIVVANPATTVALGPIDMKFGIAVFGLLVTGILMAKKVKGSILIGIFLSTILAVITGVAHFKGSIVAGINPSMFKTIFQFNPITASIDVIKAGLLGTVFALLISDFFDTMGTVVAVGAEAGFVKKDGKVPGLNRILFVDSLAAMIGGLFGCSSVTTYVESASGVGEGGRTGLTSVTAAVLFFASIFFWPIIGIVPAQATAPALIIVGFLMLMVAKDIEWDNFYESIPAYLTIVSIPFTFSIATGIGIGFIAYVVIKLFSGKAKDVHWLMYLVSILFLLDFLRPLLKF